ncbi:MAG TPA: hypothetical protein DCK81_01385 [Clostridiales bacterium UBA9856]|nr:hypothetical protein [Clostridiales bacterium UBA9856]
MTTFLSITKLLILVCIVVVLPIYIYFQYPEFFMQFRTLESINDYLSRYHTASIFVYLGLQIVQIVISIIPGQIVQFAGGYAYGFWLGYLLAISGIAIGTSIAFGLARVLGRDGVHLLFGEKRITKFVNQLNSKRAIAILLVLFAIPGFPKDLITYAAGISNFKYKPFLLLSLIGRTPALMGTILMGSMLNSESYLGLAIFGISAVILCIYLWIKRHELTSYVDKMYNKFINYNQ